MTCFFVGRLICHLLCGIILVWFCSPLQRSLNLVLFLQMSSRLLNVNIGLKLASKKGFSDLIVESDSLVAIKLLTGSCSTNHSSNQLVCNIGQLADQRSLVWHHVFWGVNQVADSLAKKGNMSIEAMAMAGKDYKECCITLEECDPQQPPLYLVAEPNELVKVAAVKIKAKIRDWAKAVASSTSKQLSVANEKCKLSTCS
ncbi:uncharacterized protein LOC114381967 isoform X1 [Glycine soja]|uniref:uncharacterized protein LOC114381967 isoform X1 n=1 Tax=Glycine soja TaxID=3848 RepID=UPI00103D9ABF|nr:uncharacterized protein LOC114381967 isoform X1 [Glycine soja]